MISRLRRKICLLLSILIGAIFIGVLFVLNWLNYNNQLSAYRGEVREEIQEIGWWAFLAKEPEEVYLEGTDYGIVRISKDGELEVIRNQFSEMTEQELLACAGTHLTRLKAGSEGYLKESFAPMIYLRKDSRKMGRNLVVLSVKPVWERALPFLWVSAAMAVLGIAAVVFATMRLSRWLVRPVEASIRSEKLFMSNASHELKTPLTVIGTNVALLSEEIGENKHLDYIRQETQRMTQLINRMLTLVRLDAPQQEDSYRKFRADTALQEVIFPLESVAYEKKLRMEVQIQEPMQIYGNEEQLKSVVSNLLDNAIAYTAEGGAVSVLSHIRAHSFYLKVSNTGEPIPEEVRERLFERFYRQNESRSGDDSHYGLGLSIVGGIVANHHGTVHVTSEGGWNSFTVTLPVERRTPR